MTNTHSAPSVGPDGIGADYRKKHLPVFFRIIFDALVGFVKCQCTSDSAAASMWVPPSHQPLRASVLLTALSATRPIPEPVPSSSVELRRSCPALRSTNPHQLRGDFLLITNSVPDNPPKVRSSLSNCMMAIDSSWVNSSLPPRK